MSVAIVKKLIQQRRHLAVILSQHHRFGSKPEILAAHLQVIREKLSVNPDLALEEFRYAVGLDCSIQALHYALAKTGTTS